MDQCVIWKGPFTVMNPLWIIIWLCSPSQCYRAFGGFWITVLVFRHRDMLSSSSFPDAAGSCFQRKGFNKLTVCYVLSTNRKTDKHSNKLVKKVKCFSAKEPDIFLRNWEGTRIEWKVRVNIEQVLIRCQETLWMLLQMSSIWQVLADIHHIHHSVLYLQLVPLLPSVQYK